MNLKKTTDNYFPIFLSQKTCFSQTELSISNANVISRQTIIEKGF